jgi:hypothetical protein
MTMLLDLSGSILSEIKSLLLLEHIRIIKNFRIGRGFDREPSELFSPSCASPGRRCLSSV